tara:strand:- start:1371 stop:1574 length:204 start_codon:yes stop_codon:yes gene_type:complete
MKPSEIFKQLAELREQVKNQAFKFTKEQQAEYDRLIGLRRERVKFFYKNGLVQKGGSTIKKATENPK